MKFIDLHCDTIYRMHRSDKEISLKKNNLHVDLDKLKKSNSLAQFFALFIEYNDLPDKYSDYNDYLMSMLDRFYLEIDKHDEINVARNYYELKENEKRNKISAFLTLEEGGIIGKDLYNLRNLYRLGVRLITLTWNFPNTIGYPNSKIEYRNKGLTDFGKEVIKEMNSLGMIIDVSHLSDGGFYDVSKLSYRPFIASHSNSRTITNHPRNLTDDMIKIISNSGGIIGINFCPSFVDKKRTTIKGLVRHIKHIKKIGEIDVLSLGSDFDGIHGDLEIKNIGEIDKLFDFLIEEGFTVSEIEKIAYENSLRVIKEVLK